MTGFWYYLFVILDNIVSQQSRRIILNLNENGGNGLLWCHHFLKNDRQAFEFEIQNSKKIGF